MSSNSQSWQAGGNYDYRVLDDLDLSGLDLCTSSFEGASMNGVHLSDSQLRYCNLRHANLALADLCRSDFQNACLTSAQLDGANLTNACFNKCCLEKVRVRHAKLRGTVLRNSNLRGAAFSGVNFGGADLSGANLSHAQFFQCNFEDANLSDTHWGLGCFADCDLSNARGLDSIVHASPTSLGLDTIRKSFKSRGSSFLRNCGVLDDVCFTSFGDTDHNEIYFIVHSDDSKDVAAGLCNSMRSIGLRTWIRNLDRECSSIKIDYRHVAVLLLTKGSIGSTWLSMELARAWNWSERKLVATLLPVSLLSKPEIQEWSCANPEQAIDFSVHVRSRLLELGIPQSPDDVLRFLQRRRHGMQHETIRTSGSSIGQSYGKVRGGTDSRLVGIPE